MIVNLNYDLVDKTLNYYHHKSTDLIHTLQIVELDQEREKKKETIIHLRRSKF